MRHSDRSGDAAAMHAGAPIPSGAPLGSGGGRTPRSDVVRRIGGRVARDHSSSGAVRRSLREFLEISGADASTLFDVQLAAGELVANAARYGRGSTIQWTALHAEGSLVLTFIYASDRFDPAPAEDRDAALRENGRGILLIRSLMDEAHFRFQRGQLRVTLIKRLHS